VSAPFEQTINWYPGHMVTAMRRIGEYMQLIDIVIEVIDARVPLCGANPALDKLAGKRPRLVVLTREDLAERETTAAWVAHFVALRGQSLAVDGRHQSDLALAAGALSALAPKGGTMRALVAGLPNSGKSSVINGLLRRAAAKTENRAGVTRATQWFRLGPHLEIMDTPGVLVPKIETPDAQWMLAITGAVPRDRYDPQDVVERFHTWLRGRGDRTIPDLEAFAAARGFLRRGNTADLHNAARSYIRDLNDGKFGRISFEKPGDDGQAA